MLRPINAIIRDNIGNIIHRGFVVTGEVAVDNEDGSYDVYISGEAKAYPKIFTLARNPDLAVGDKVRILYKNGCKELPIILPPVAPSVVYRSLIFSASYTGDYNYTITIMDTDGNILHTFGLESGDIINDFDCTCTDKYGNFYVLVNRNKIRKYDYQGNLLLTKAITHYCYSIAIDANGYIWTAGYYDTWDNGQLVKLNPDTLEKESAFPTTDDNYWGLVIDADSYAYVISFASPYGIEKWNLKTGIKVGDFELASGDSVFNSLAIAGDYIFSADWLDHIWRVNKDLSGSIYYWGILDSLRPYGQTSIGGNLVTQGRYYVSSEVIIGKYQPDKTKLWFKEITAAGHTSAGICAYPF